MPRASVIATFLGITLLRTTLLGGSLPVALVAHPDAQIRGLLVPASLDPCALLTKADAVAAVGEGLDEGKPTGPFAVPMGGLDTMVSACAYESPRSAHNIKLTVHRVQPDKTARFRELYRGICERRECVAGLGDSAWWYSPQHEELQVLTSAELLIFKISRSGDGKDALLAAARKTLGRLP
jgi:hypothetical protein